MSNKRKVYIKSICMLLMLMLILMIPTFSKGINTVMGEEESSSSGGVGSRAKELSKNGDVHKEMYEKIKKDIGSYVYSNSFQLTRYSPRDASFKSSVNAGGEKDARNSSFTMTYWYKKEGKWLYSTTSYERMEKAKVKFKGKYKMDTKMIEYGGEKYPIFKLTMDGEISESDRKATISPRCDPTVQANTKSGGLPFQGAIGKTIEWGSIAIDRNKLTMDKDYFIENYGYAHARDVGGAIKGNHIDLYWDDCEDVFSSGGTKNNQIVIMKKSDNKGVSDVKPLTEDILEKVYKSKKWGDEGADVDLSGSDNGDSSESNSNSSESASTYKEFNPFVDRKVSTNAIRGVDSGNLSIPSEFMNGAYSVVYVIQKVGSYAMVILSLIMVLMLSLQMATLALINRGSERDWVYKIQEKIYGYETSGRDYIKVIVRNFVLIVAGLFVIIGGIYPVIQYRIYLGIATFLQMVGLG